MSASSPRYRFFLDGNKQISEPIGWNNIKLELNRDKKYYSLIESVEIPFEFYGNSADGDGGYEYLKQAKQSGPDTQIEFTADISWDYGDTWERFFYGLLDLTTLIEIRNKRRFQCTITRESNWTKFYNLQDNPVQIKSGDSLSNSLTLPTQKIRQEFRGEFSGGHLGAFGGLSYLFNSPIVTGNDQYGHIDWESSVRNEIMDTYALPFIDGIGNGITSAEKPVWKFELEEQANLVITGEFRVANRTIPDTPGAAFWVSSDFNVYIQYNDETPIAWSRSNIGSNGTGTARTVFSYTDTISLEKGTRITLYFYYGLTSAYVVEWIGPDFFSIVADTTYPDSVVPAFLIHDVADKILNNNLGEHYFYSEYFGGVNTKYIDYSTDGCGTKFELTKGIYFREVALTDKPFDISWNKLWSGLDPIFCLGAGYEYVRFDLISGGFSEREMLVVMPREYFFDPIPSLELEEYNEDFRLEVSYDPQFLITSLKNGYQKWQAQSKSGLDDPQTSHNYTTRFKTIGDEGSKSQQVLSTFVAASLVIEQGRRIEDKSKDWQMDEETFIIQVSSPTTVKTYSSGLITGLINASTRYNVRLTPTSNFNRWAKWLSIGFQEYIGDTFRFAGGEGNTLMSFNDPTASGCDLEPGKSADEDANIAIVNSYLLPEVYKFQVGMTWEQYKAVRDNRRQAIALNYIDNGEEVRNILYIDNLTYFPNESKAEIKAWRAKT